MKHFILGILSTQSETLRVEYPSEKSRARRPITKGTIGSSFDDFLKEEEIYETVQVSAIKRVLAWQLEQAMTNESISKSEMARRMNTSRSQLDRLLDPENPRIQLDTVMKAAAALGKEFRMELVDSEQKVA